MNYFLFGQTLQSDISFSQVLQSSIQQPNICIEAGFVTVPALARTNIFRRGVQAQFGCTDTSFFLRWEGIGIFQVSNGNHIVYQNLGADEGTLRLFLLSEVMGLALLQQGYLLLHGSAVMLHNEAVVFLGRPGAGKSTTAAAFQQAGYTVLSDDLIAIQMVDGHPCVIPAFAQFKIWKESVAGLNIDTTSLAPSFEGSTKYLISQSLESFPRHPVPLREINILLPSHSRTKASVINPVNVPSELLRHYPLPSQTLQPAALMRNFQDSVHIAQQVPVHFLSRPKTFDALMQFVCTLADRPQAQPHARLHARLHARSHTHPSTVVMDLSTPAQYSS